MSTTPLGPGPDVHTLTGAYAADALDPASREEFEVHLAQCDDCREEVRGLRETVALLGVAAAVPPPQRMRSSVLAEIARTPQVPPAPLPAVVVPLQQRRSVATRWLAAAASLLVAATIGAGVLGVQADRRADEAQARLDRIESVVADPSARTVRADVTGGGTATLVVAGSDAVLLADGLAALPEDRAYQVWLVAGEEITSAGMGPAADAGASRWSRLVDGLDSGVAVALSVEPQGGSQQPTTTPVVLLQT